MLRGRKKREFSKSCLLDSMRSNKKIRKTDWVGDVKRNLRTIWRFRGWSKTEQNGQTRLKRPSSYQKPIYKNINNCHIHLQRNIHSKQVIQENYLRCKYNSEKAEKMKYFRLCRPGRKNSVNLFCCIIIIIKTKRFYLLLFLSMLQKIFLKILRRSKREKLKATQINKCF